MSLRPGRSVAADLLPAGSLVRARRLAGKTLRSSQTGRLEVQKTPRAREVLGAWARAVLLRLML